MSANLFKDNQRETYRPLMGFANLNMKAFLTNIKTQAITSTVYHAHKKANGCITESSLKFH